MRWSPVAQVCNTACWTRHNCSSALCSFSACEAILLLLRHSDIQVGLAEMQSAVEQTGGLLVQASTFSSQAFRESFRRVFAPPDDEGYLGIHSNAQLQVRVYHHSALHLRSLYMLRLQDCDTAVSAHQLSTSANMSKTLS